MNDAQRARHIEGLLFALGKPLSRSELIKMLNTDEASIEAAIGVLRMEQEKRGMVAVDDGTMLELRAAPDVASIIEQIRREERSRDVGRAGLEVLSAVLYRGPLTRAEIDFIRGVNSSQTLRTLTMRGLVRKVSNPSDERSFRYEATTDLLASMGATSVHDVPDFDAVRAKLSQLEEAYRGAQSPEPA
jgi:segregation and condensation protein B